MPLFYPTTEELSAAEPAEPIMIAAVSEAVAELRQSRITCSALGKLDHDLATNPPRDRRDVRRLAEHAVRDAYLVQAIDLDGHRRQTQLTKALMVLIENKPKRQTVVEMVGPLDD